MKIMSNKNQDAAKDAFATTETHFTWDDLAEAIAKLSPEQRKKQVHISIDDESVFQKVAGLETVANDVYVSNDDADDCGDLETLQDVHGDDFNIEDYRLATQKGHPFLFNEF